LRGAAVQGVELRADQHRVGLAHQAATRALALRGTVALDLSALQHGSRIPGKDHFLSWPSGRSINSTPIAWLEHFLLDLRFAGDFVNHRALL
jgi:hypothetical protein